MKTIHKYVLETVENKVSTFEGARWLHVANQHEHITVWAEVDTSQPTRTRTLYVVGTGHSVPDEAKHHIGSVLVAGGDFVFHIYAGDES